MQNLYNKIAEWLCSFGQDKYMHYIILLIFTFVSSKLLNYYIDDLYISILISGITGLAISIGKELWDLKREGVFDSKDIISGILGTITGALMCML